MWDFSDIALEDMINTTAENIHGFLFHVLVLLTLNALPAFEEGGR